ncbi:MAG: aldehyde ferredoxin oxidoreductase [Myxococcota bacterium]|jgi:glyceraldehyde-3-phosphate dehydrogenase (ferredoxin)|nr:aldehyde ferredoxin oxidoreductase [Myxococcota bacterium]
METQLKVLHVDAASGFYKIERFPIGPFFGPVDLGLHLAGKHNALSFGTGLLCGSIFPGSNRLVFSGFSPCWGGFYISSMGGAGLVFDNLGINLCAIRGKAGTPSLLYLNRTHGEEVEVEIVPMDVDRVWSSGRGGVYAVMAEALWRFSERYKEDPRVLAVGPAARSSDVGAVVSVPIVKGELTFVDTWAGRGGFGSKLFQEHGLVGVIYGGTYLDEDFRDRKVANEWFEQKYNKKMVTKDMDATVKYRHDPDLDTGGTFGVNYKKMGGKLLAFNYRSIYMSEDERKSLQQTFVHDHYLKQFNEEIINAPRSESFKNCGEPCVALCKKMRGEFKKDYEPYQCMGPLSGIFDQRAAEKLNHHADMLGFDGISIGGVISWLMECQSEGLLTKAELGVTLEPVLTQEGFDVVATSMNNAQLGVELLDSIIAKRGVLDMSEGPRQMAKKLGKQKGQTLLDRFVYCANARRGWMVPNQYWTPGVLSPMPIMGKYYMHYADEFLPPRELGRKDAERMRKELVLDQAGYCRFHRGWAEEMLPEIIGTLYGKQAEFLSNVSDTASRIGSRNAAVYWESARNVDFVLKALERFRDVGGNNSGALAEWIDAFTKDPKEAALNYWFEIRKGIEETL